MTACLSCRAARRLAARVDEGSMLIDDVIRNFARWYLLALQVTSLSVFVMTIYKRICK